MKGKCVLNQDWKFEKEKEKKIKVSRKGRPCKGDRMIKVEKKGEESKEIKSTKKRKRRKGKFVY